MTKKCARGAYSPMERGIDVSVRQVATELFLGLGTPYAVAQARNLISGNDEAYVASEVILSGDVDRVRDDLLCKSYLAKWPGLNLGVDRRRVALESFEAAEKSCAETNYRLSHPDAVGLLSPYTAHNVFHVARQKIRKLLGPFSWDHAADHFGHSSGASFGLRRLRGDAYYKYGAKPQATENCLVLAYTAIKQCPRWLHHVVSLSGLDPDTMNQMPLDEFIRHCIEVVPGNKVWTVPKNAKTDRVIAIEPHMNMYVQKGIGALIRRRLKRVSIDLDDQSRNQALAGVHPDYGLVTIDLKAASDSVSLELVRQLLPPDWCEAIQMVRSERGVLPSGEIIEYQKVSSMGNGCTFELESLIFWALCSSVADVFHSSGFPIGVFGDDIICHRSIAHTVIWMLGYAGFTTNVEKTHVSGGYRESCGKHFFYGRDVTPCHISDDVTSVELALVAANNLRRWGTGYASFDERVVTAYNRIVRSLPAALRKPKIPDGIGDWALMGSLDEVRPSRHPCWDGWIVKVWMKFRHTFQPTDDMYLLRQLANRDDHSVVPVSQFVIIDECLKWSVKEPSLNSGVPTPKSVWRSGVSLFVRRWDLGVSIP